MPRNSEEYGSSRDFELEVKETTRDQVEIDAVDAFIGERAYEIWQKNGRDDELENIIDEMWNTYDRASDSPSNHQPDWMPKVREKIAEARKFGAVEAFINERTYGVWQGDVLNDDMENITQDLWKKYNDAENNPSGPQPDWMPRVRQKIAEAVSRRS